MTCFFDSATVAVVLDPDSRLYAVVCSSVGVKPLVFSGGVLVCERACVCEGGDRRRESACASVCKREVLRVHVCVACISPKGLRAYALIC